MKKLSTLRYLLLLIFCSISFLNGYSQSLTEDFEYTKGSLLTANGYTAFSGGGTNPITVTSPGLVYTGSPSSGVGNAVTMATSGEDDSRVFAPTINSGNAYASFLINVTSAQSGGDYFFSLYDGTFITRVYAKSSGTGYVLGVSKSSGAVIYDATVRAFNTVNVVVLKYTFNTGTTNDDVISLYVNPALGQAEPTATIASIGAGTNDGGTFDRIALRQGSATAAAGLIIDGIRVGTTWASVTPAVAPPTPTTTSISPASANVGDADFTLTVNGTDFLSGLSTVTWNGNNRTTTFVSATQVTAAIPGTDLSGAGTATVGVTTTGAAASSNTQTFTINASVGPTFVIKSNLADFGNVCSGSTAGPNSFSFDGNNLNGSTINIAELSGFTYSESAIGPYTSTLSFAGGTGFTSKMIYVKFNPTAVQSYDDNIVVTGGGATSNIAVHGSGVSSPPSPSTGSSSAVTPTSATATGSITAPGCSAVTAYGIEYSTATGFPDGSGTQLLSTNLNAGSFSVNLTGLSPNVRYYFKAYATNSNGTAYGTQQAFTCSPLPVKMSAQSGLTFTEDFSDIANWGSFFSVGIGANHWVGLSSNATAPGVGIPNGTTITAASTSFQGATFLSSGGVQKGTDQLVPDSSMVLLSTGSPDNTTSTAIDFYLDFTGVNANTLSFDYETLNNSTGDRNGSLRVYTSIDGVTFKELADAGVLSFTNNVLISGSKTNVVLPIEFNNSPNARLRFYYHNGSGGTGSGSRPKISFDNLKITAVATTPCASPTAPATTLTFGTIDDVSIKASFTGTSSADNYIVVMSNSNSLTGMPVDGQMYALGDNVGDGTVIFSGAGTSFTATGLTASSTYYFFIFPVNSICTGGPLYYITNVLNGTASTVAGLPPCVAPTTQPTSLTFTAVAINSIQGSFVASSASGYLVLRSKDAALTDNPVNGQAYNAGNVIGNATVVQAGTATTFEANGLTPDTQYYFFIFSLNSSACVNGPVYNTVSPLNGSQKTDPLPPCAAPVSQPGLLTLTSSNTAISGSFVPASGTDNYLVVRSLSPTLTGFPVNNTDYNVGDNLGGGVVVANSSSNSFLTNNLTPLTTYYFYIFASNKNCAGGTKYLIVNPLTGNKATTNALVNNYYFGNLHSHSDYSDGNQDHLGGTPAVSYNYAKTALCMDYLGISEHNHYSTAKNPGNQIATYHLGSLQADSFTVANPNFLALYGMEWGVISGGGHVVVYGDKMDDLFGWESGSGGWGPTNNYDVYVPKSTYTGPTGLFKTINDYVAKNTFATLAHPNQTDYNNIAGTPYDIVADNAITGSAVESGPATSTNTTYTNPGSSLYYLPYFQTLLSKGYHLGPTIDHDNHNTTFGHTTYSRTAILAPALTKTEIVKAMRNMHFYATQDCDSKVDFSINTQMMGSILTDRYAPNVSVTLSDATTPTASAKIVLFFGIPGSGVMPEAIDSTIGNTYSFTDNNLSNSTTGYYYIEIVNGTAKIITAPIWYTRDDNFNPLPVKLSAFAVQKVGTAVKLTWTTEQEVNTRSFIIERSADGTNWNPIETVNAAGNSNNRINYTAYDNSPLIGINYYRLKQVDVDGKLDYSPVKSVAFSTQYQVNVTPNPATDFVNITLTKSDYSAVNIELINVAGKVVKQISTSQTLVQMKVNNLAKGTYFIKVTDGKGVTTQKLVIQ